MHLKRTTRTLAIYLPNGAVFAGKTYEECYSAAREELVFNKEKLLKSAIKGYIDENDTFQSL